MPDGKAISTIYSRARELEDLNWTGKSLSQAYRRAGEDFLAGTLKGMFTHLTSADVGEHNKQLDQILLMVGDEPRWFFRTLAHEILLEKKAKVTLLKKVAKSIFSVPKG